MNEFDIIQYYFNKQAIKDTDLIVKNGDDAAVIAIPQDQYLVTSVDTLIYGIHCPLSTPPDAIAYKALAVNISDLAAMGAMPKWFTLALTLPSVDMVWLEQFSQGLFKIANQYDISLIGGDTTKGSLSVTIQVMGVAPKQVMLTRDRAKKGDLIYVSGTIGEAGLALKTLQSPNKLSKDISSRLQEKLFYPSPRIDLGLLLRDIAHAVIDISDGLLADLQHILDASQLGAKIYLTKIPYAQDMFSYYNNLKNQIAAITAGDDYELCFTIPAEKQSILIAIEEQLDYPLTLIGVIEDNLGLRVLDKDHQIIQMSQFGYQHF